MTEINTLPLDNPALAIDQALGGFAQYAGHRVCELGEDCEQLLVDGHPDDEAVLAAINAYAYAMWGEGGHTLEEISIRRQWAAFRPHRDGCDDAACRPCAEGRHDECEGKEPETAYCECDGSGSGHQWTCSCDEYAWFLDTKDHRALLAKPDADYHAVTVVDR